MQNHLVVERLIDPAGDDFFDVREIHDHAERIELGGLKADDRPAIVAVKVLAFAVVVQQAMAIAKTNLAGHAIHGLSEFRASGIGYQCRVPGFGYRVSGNSVLPPPD